MSEPLNPEQIAPELIGTGAQSLVDNAKRLGLTWNLTLATISTSGPTALTPLTIQGIVDGDTVPIGLISMIGPVANGQRVYVIQVPPSGNYIVGRPNAEFLGANIDVSGINTTSSGAEVAVPSLQWAYEPIYAFQPGRIYRVDLFVGQVSATGQQNAFQLNVRKGSASVSGTLIAGALGFTDVTAFNNSSIMTFDSYIKNDSTAVVNSQLSVTITRIGGAGTVNMNNERLVVKDYGSTSDPSITRAAVQI